jgi:hypothetical protein
MEWSIPLQNFEASHLKHGALSKGIKPLLPISYKDEDVEIQSVLLLLPTLPVKSYDSTTGKLVLSLTGQAVASKRLASLQDSLLATLGHLQRELFPSERPKSAEALRSGFQPLLDGSNLILYCPCAPSGTGAGGAEVNLYSKGVWSRGKLTAGTVLPGTRVRVALRVQGLSFHQSPETGAWTGRFRIQHRIVALLIT